jgi:FAD/FMN-containing dehydrogenase
MLSLLFSLLLTATSAEVLSERQLLGGSNVCQQVTSKVAGQVYESLSLSLNFLADTEHFMSSSSETPVCAVEVTSAEDVSEVLKIVGATRTPFAVKSGGHASNPGFSSTTGVFISLAKLKQITLSADKSTIEIGLGNVRFVRGSRIGRWANKPTDLERRLSCP